MPDQTAQRYTRLQPSTAGQRTGPSSRSVASTATSSPRQTLPDAAPVPHQAYICPVNDPAESFVVRMVVEPDNVPADHAGPFAAGVVGAVEREVAPRFCRARVNVIRGGQRGMLAYWEVPMPRSWALASPFASIRKPNSGCPWRGLASEMGGRARVSSAATRARFGGCRRGSAASHPVGRSRPRAG